jgi:gluconolactonase
MKLSLPIFLATTALQAADAQSKSSKAAKSGLGSKGGKGHETIDFENAKQVVLDEYDGPIAHEATVVLPDGDLLFRSNRFKVVENEPENQYVILSKYSFASDETIDLGLRDKIPMANGATLLQDGTVAITSQGTLDELAGVATWDPTTGHVKWLTTGWGSQNTPFNSPNDIVQAKDGSLWFTDPAYGAEQGFRPPPTSPNGVWRYDPKTDSSRLMIDGFVKPNGIAFSLDETYVYVGDTGYVSGDGSKDPTRPRTIYRYRIADGPLATERTTFAIVDVPIPDGIKVDNLDRVWVGTKEGLQVFSKHGFHLGTLPVDGGVNNFAFATEYDPSTIYSCSSKKLIQINIDCLALF